MVSTLTRQTRIIKTFSPLLKRAMQDSPNESQSRLLLDRILQDVLGYAVNEIKTEQKIQGRIADYVLAPGDVDTLVIEAKRLGATASLDGGHSVSHGTLSWLPSSVWTPH